jgi:hypothetical protein
MDLNFELTVQTASLLLYFELTALVAAAALLIFRMLERVASTSVPVTSDRIPSVCEYWQ